ncbi:unnamed protein product, partial [marine sediment metagenome]
KSDTLGRTVQMWTYRGTTGLMILAGVHLRIQGTYVGDTNTSGFWSGSREWVVGDTYTFEAYKDGWESQEDTLTVQCIGSLNVYFRMVPL